MVTAQQVKQLFAGISNTNSTVAREFVDYVFGNNLTGGGIIKGDLTIEGNLIIQKDQNTFFNCFIQNNDPGNNASAAYVAQSGSTVGAFGSASALHLDPIFAGKAGMFGINNGLVVGSFLEGIDFIAGGNLPANLWANLDKNGIFSFFGNIRATNLPISPIGLPSKSLWNNAGVINITP